MSLQIHAPQDSQHWLIQAQKDLETSLIRLQEEREAHSRTISSHNQLIVEHHELAKRLVDASHTHLDTVEKFTSEKHAHEDLKSSHRELSIKHSSLSTDHEAACSERDKLQRCYVDHESIIAALNARVAAATDRCKYVDHRLLELNLSLSTMEKELEAIKSNWWYKFCMWIGL